MGVYKTFLKYFSHNFFAKMTTQRIYLRCLRMYTSYALHVYEIVCIHLGQCGLFYSAPKTTFILAQDSLVRICEQCIPVKLYTYTCLLRLYITMVYIKDFQTDSLCACLNQYYQSYIIITILTILHSYVALMSRDSKSKRQDFLFYCDLLASYKVISYKRRGNLEIKIGLTKHVRCIDSNTDIGIDVSM